MRSLMILWKDINPLKLILILACVFAMDFIVVTILFDYGYIDWLWNCFVGLVAKIFFVYVGSPSVDLQVFSCAVLKAFAGLVSGTCILVFLWECVPCVVLKIFGEQK